MHGVLHASIITRTCFWSLILLVQHLVVWVVATQMQSRKHKVATRSFFYLWHCYKIYIACQNSLPISLKPSQMMVPHLAKCHLVAPHIRAHAAEENNAKKSHRGPGDPPMLEHSAATASVPFPAIKMGSGYASLVASATPSPIPSPLLLSAPLLNIEWPLKCSRVSSFTVGLDSSPSLVERVWNPFLQQEFGEDFSLQLTHHGTQHKIHRCNYLLRSGFQAQ